MKKYAKVLTLVLTAALLLSVAACAQAAPKTEKLSIGILQYVDHVALDASKDGVSIKIMSNSFLS